MRTSKGLILFLAREEPGEVWSGGQYEAPSVLPTFSPFPNPEDPRLGSVCVPTFCVPAFYVSTCPVAEALARGDLTSES